ncbi:MAG: hypothetical protein L3J93_05995, partial [Thermoplasmata archaeon]|nr:hypothetical protein [Thermoplasmata archaeon]
LGVWLLLFQIPGFLTWWRDPSLAFVSLPLIGISLGAGLVLTLLTRPLFRWQTRHGFRSTRLPDLEVTFGPPGLARSVQLLRQARKEFDQVHSSAAVASLWMFIFVLTGLTIALDFGAGWRVWWEEWAFGIPKLILPVVAILLSLVAGVWLLTQLVHFRSAVRALRTTEERLGQLEWSFTQRYWMEHAPPPPP